MRSGVLLIFLFVAVLAGCSSAPKAPVSATTPNVRTPLPHITQSNSADILGNDIVFQAFSLIGTPYRYGGTSPDTGFDCSGLIQYVYREAAGVNLPRTTAGLTSMRTAKPSESALVPGDLLLFAMNGGRVNHAGIYIGEGRFLHAPSTGGAVRVDELGARYWQRTYKGARRVLSSN
ncbi:C40 family peptidase [Halopseudomonas sp.]|uniref:C40 family peptidase n=1 Tax=Halopseudomonas sp. TaxID=2901191 RepID=UPI0030015A3D